MIKHIIFHAFLALALLLAAPQGASADETAGKLYSLHMKYSKNALPQKLESLQTAQPKAVQSKKTLKQAGKNNDFADLTVVGMTAETFYGSSHVQLIDEGQAPYFIVGRLVTVDKGKEETTLSSFVKYIMVNPQDPEHKDEIVAAVDALEAEILQQSGLSGSDVRLVKKNKILTEEAQELGLSMGAIQDVMAAGIRGQNSTTLSGILGEEECFVDEENTQLQCVRSKVPEVPMVCRNDCPDGVLGYFTSTRPEEGVKLCRNSIYGNWDFTVTAMHEYVHATQPVWQPISPADTQFAIDENCTMSMIREYQAYGCADRDPGTQSEVICNSTWPSTSGRCYDWSRDSYVEEFCALKVQLDYIQHPPYCPTRDCTGDDGNGEAPGGSGGGESGGGNNGGGDGGCLDANNNGVCDDDEEGSGPETPLPPLPGGCNDEVLAAWHESSGANDDIPSHVAVGYMDCEGNLVDTVLARERL